MITHGQTITWTDFNGTRSSFEATGCVSAQAALREAIAGAKAFGWTPPKWWQWWRWHEPIRSEVPGATTRTLTIIALALLLTGCPAIDTRCEQGTGYTWQCDSAGNCGCHSNPGGR